VECREVVFQKTLFLTEEYKYLKHAVLLQFVDFSFLCAICMNRMKFFIFVNKW
jgi:hypothetical protein